MSRIIYTEDVTIEMWHPGDELNNDDRADMVRPLVQTYHDAYYHHPAGEPLATVIGDLIGDLLHLYERLDDDQLDDPPQSPEAMLQRALDHYIHERDEEAADGQPD